MNFQLECDCFIGFFCTVNVRCFQVKTIFYWAQEACVDNLCYYRCIQIHCRNHKFFFAMSFFHRWLLFYHLYPPVLYFPGISFFVSPNVEIVFIPFLQHFKWLLLWHLVQRFWTKCWHNQTLNMVLVLVAW